MQTFAHYALPGTILASALGAVVLCIVLLLYGFKTEPDDERSPARRLLAIRFGHAMAAACFAAALILSTAALIDQRRAALAEPTPAARRTEDVQRLRAQLRALERRLADVENARVVVASAAVADARRPAVAPPAPPRPRATVPARRPSPAPAPAPDDVSASPSTRDEPMLAQPASSVPTTVSSDDDLGAKFRDDWDTVKQGFREAGRDIRSGFVDLGRRIKRTFGD
jgi:hypothetical protein